MKNFNALSIPQIVEKMMISLPKKFESKVSVIEKTCDLEKLSVAELISKLQAQEQRVSISSVDLPTKKTKLLAGVYESCSLALIEPACYEEATKYKMGMSLKLSFMRSETEATLYVKGYECDQQLVVSVYVDDLLITDGNSQLVQQFKQLMMDEFAMSDLEKLWKEDGEHKTDATIFRSLIGVFTWSFKKQEVVAQSTAESEYILAAAAANHAILLRKILSELNMIQLKPTTIYVDNKSAIAIANNPVQHRRSKHIKVKFHFLQEAEKNQEIHL
ncbi:hypothetical protein MANES_12G105811v8 [Manihot esculenta]|uniref:Uncharacterized protein n=1 Tax=Manihot esculenta TaxID=3983 RepID=A0ACB7GQK1_MANES|nr:hypothetical protein MANES_12G105811v8 [Manihot esculenta]